MDADLLLVNSDTVNWILASDCSIVFQGGALSAMLDFFKTIVAAGMPGLGHSDLLALLAHPVLGTKGGNIHKAGRANIAKCVASLVSIACLLVESDHVT